MKKRFGFSLVPELHAALQARAEAEGISMAAVCREALLAHLQKPALELPLPPRADISSPAWGSLKQSVHEYLGRQEYDDTLDELDDFLSEPFRPEDTPDLLYRVESPRRKHVLHHNPPPRTQSPVVSDHYGTRWLDELWA